jgi:O-antigen ligase
MSLETRDRLTIALPAAAAVATCMAWAPHEVGRRVFDVLVFAMALLISVTCACGRLPLRLPRWSALVFLPASWGALQFGSGASVYLFATWTSALHWAALATFLIVTAVAAAKPEGRERLLVGFGVFAGIAGPVCLVQFFTSRGLVFWLFASGYDAALGPFVNRNTFACFCEASLPVVVWLGIRRSEFRPLALTAAGVLVAGPVVTGARAGTLLMASEVAALVFALRHRLRPAVLASGLGAALLFVAAAGWQPLVRRLKDPDPWMYRREAIESSVAMIRDRPLTGFGLGTFQYAYPAYALVDYGVVLNHAHNDWLEFAVEGGLPFGALMLLAAGFAARLAVRQPWGLGLPFVFLHSAVDFPLKVDAVSVWILLLAAAAVQGFPSKKGTAVVDMSSVGYQRCPACLP